MHKHNWQTIPKVENTKHQNGNRYLSYEFIQICECGTYQTKEFLHVEDLKNKGDAK